MSTATTTTFVPVDPDADAALLHAWVTHPRSVYWQMQDATVEDVRTEYARIAADPHHRAFLGHVDGRPALLAEVYDPAHSELAGVYDVLPGDRGMHVLVAPTDTPVHGFTDRAFAAVMRLVLDDPAVARVVVEPDVRNAGIALKNAKAGFVVDRAVELGVKRAALSFCTREQFAASPLGGDL
ncbi:GNAT family N-acetyltransferase [Aeromicrobium sp. IC_218]|uniref:GNAT family N-acetyltransferase n=1 Tax=Aeromicrobium sp. IC_218 TaxID=2545468 RepID=UPI00103F0747|nr:GNAT family N-acetyltransferase [Aeromicrobium sp. IC_218]TCI99530.1 N-acetyltransferase [Aeromicrobium sp. IC_218]